MKEINGKENFEGSINTFQINFNTNSKGQNLGSLGFELRQAGNYVSGSYQSLSVPNEYLGSGIKNCFISAALLEMLLQLTNKIYIKGDTGTGRGLIGSNFSELTAENNSISDHAFGRGLDIFVVGNNPSSSYEVVSSLDNFRKALDIFLTNLQTLSKDLHPDLIIVHDLLAEELGILENGLEAANAPVRTKYPHLAPFINFATDSNHRNHIHISFSAQRAGSFMTQDMLQPLMSDNQDSFSRNLSRSTNSNLASNLDKFKISYFDKPNDLLTADEVMYLLSTAGIFSDEVSALFVGIGERESRWRPGALNEVKKEGSGDFSFGAFQCNLLPAAHGRKKFILKYSANGQAYDDTVLGLKLAYSIDEDEDIESLSRKVVQKATKATVDRRIFIPYNQVWMLGTVATSEQQVAKASRGSLIDSYIFNAWGDYNNSDGSPRSEVGFIFKVSFSTVLSAYKLVGKNQNLLESWIRNKFKNKRPFPYIEKWMDGVVFDSNGNEV